MNVQRVGGFIGTLLWAIVQVLAVAALAILVLLLFPKPTERVSNALEKQPFVHWGIGLLTMFAAPIAFVVMMITILLIPGRINRFSRSWVCTVVWMDRAGL